MNVYERQFEEWKAAQVAQPSGTLSEKVAAAKAHHKATGELPPHLEAMRVAEAAIPALATCEAWAREHVAHATYGDHFSPAELEAQVARAPRPSLPDVVSGLVRRLDAQADLITDLAMRVEALETDRTNLVEMYTELNNRLVKRLQALEKPQDGKREESPVNESRTLKRALTASTVALGLIVSGCQTTGSGAPTTDPTGVVAQVQSLAVAACRFAPTAATVADILAAGNPAVSTASAVANAICAAVASAPVSAPRIYGALQTVTGQERAYGTVAGIPVRGQFVGR